MDYKCFIAYFTETDSTCKVLNLNSDFWVNSTTEILVGGLLLIGALGLFNNSRVNNVWKCVRDSRATILANDMEFYVGRIKFATLGFYNFMHRENTSNDDFSERQLFESDAALVNIRNWVSVGSSIYPMRKLKPLSEIDNSLIPIIRRHRLFSTNLVYIKKSITDGTLDGDKKVSSLNILRNDIKALLKSIHQMRKTIKVAFRDIQTDNFHTLMELLTARCEELEVQVQDLDTFLRQYYPSVESETKASLASSISRVKRHTAERPQLAAQDSISELHYGNIIKNNSRSDKLQRH